MDIIGLDLHKRESQLSITAEDGTIIDRRIVTSRERITAVLGVRPSDDNSMLILGMRSIMVIGIGSTPLTHIVLSRLLAIVETVSVGCPFVDDNAARLRSIAARASSDAHPLDIDWSFSLTRWLAVLLLFVLARVFEQGTQMREDLEGTV